MATRIAGVEELISRRLQAHEGEMLALLERLVNQDSGSYDKAGVDATGVLLKQFFEERKIPVSFVPDATYGDALIANVEARSARDRRPVVLMGHRDTVFPKGEAARRPFRIDGARAYGPGVADMKSGLVINAFVLAAFAEQGDPTLPLVALITSDEEIASPSSRAAIEQQARGARAVFNGEPGRPTGNVVTGRKGGVFMLLETFGKPAHSGVNFKEGCSAIDELALKIVALRGITDLERGTTLNVGLVRGGQSVNTVAPYAAGEIDIRYVKSADRAEALAAIEAIVANCSVPGTRAQLEINGEFLPLEKNEKNSQLFEIYAGAAADLGFPLEGEFTGGCADSGFSSALGIPTLCGTGAVGGKAHTPEEYIELPTLVPRAQALALSIIRLSQSTML